MKQFIFGSVLGLLLFGFFVYQAFGQVTGKNGGIAAGGTNGAIAGNGGVSGSGNTTNGKNAANANGDNIGNTTGLAIPGED
jgi:hypothetical protein